MPIYETDLSYDDLRKVKRRFECATCGFYLKLDWSTERNCAMLRCSENTLHDGIRPIGRDPAAIERRARLKGGPDFMETIALEKLSPEQMLARVNAAKFPKDLTVADRQLIAKVSIEYGLDPLFGELMIYQGRPYVTIDARRRKAQETNQLDGISARPATKEEKEARGVPPKDYLFRALVWVKGASHPFEGWGTVRAAETKGNEFLPIVKDPAAQAEKRAEAQALRRAFHMPLPDEGDIVEGQFTEIKVEPSPAPAPSTAPGLTRATSAPGVRKKLTQAQRTKIQSSATQAGYKEAEVLAIIKAKFGAENVDGLSLEQASKLIGMIERGEGLENAETPDLFG